MGVTVHIKDNSKYDKHRDVAKKVSQNEARKEEC